MVKAAIVIFQIIPLAAGVLALMLGALWLQIQDEKKTSAGGDAPDRGPSETQHHYTRRRRRLTSA